MSEAIKGRSPFYPGQPVPTELFVGRAAQIDHILTRGAGQVATGKPVAMFVQGDYGIGKSSIAAYALRVAEQKFDLHPLYAQLGGGENLDDIAAAVMQATVESGTFNPRRSEKVRNWLAQYVGKQSLFGVTANLAALKQDAPKIANPAGMLGFLREAHSRLSEAGSKGIFLVLDEINGITADPNFAHFVKGLVDSNAMSPEPVPLLLMLCGVEERRRDMIRNHQPIDRIFDVVEIAAMTAPEMQTFFEKAFDSVQTKVTADGLEALAYYSGGLPKIMHVVGDETFWANQDAVVDENDVLVGVMRAADEVGKKYVDQQVYRALRSADYHSILTKIATMGGPLGMRFKKSEVAEGLNEAEKGKFHNFLTRMKKLNVIRSGDTAGEWIFNVTMVRVYIWLESERHKREQASQ